MCVENNNKPLYNRVILKLSGEAWLGKKVMDLIMIS